ncbi:hypothetical protein J8273_2954 [Carpediemonas membranifera]|uniref:Vacuolar protein sorting-associated protein 54 C-terminal domain-containing protein n=1 Tax=Carpediemonas membranifera TaxID=201153 RepID=A0A8J6B970_9EUKA|nr:hypothetical protein J8273_2954 [Carpediemonas membranifera]|eukprot:KAG9395387.1 hypothetical protein J8273_2954 [Carpediemonas membranifera]
MDCLRPPPRPEGLEGIDTYANVLDAVCPAKASSLPSLLFDKVDMSFETALYSSGISPVSPNTANFKTLLQEEARLSSEFRALAARQADRDNCKSLMDFTDPSFFTETFDIWKHLEPYFIADAALDEVANELTSQVDIVEQDLTRTILLHRDDFMDHLSRLGNVHSQLATVNALIFSVRRKLKPLLDESDKACIGAMSREICQGRVTIERDIELLEILKAIETIDDSLQAVPNAPVADRTSLLLSALDGLATLPAGLRITAALSKRAMAASSALVRSHNGQLLNALVAVDSSDCGTAVGEISRVLSVSGAMADLIGRLADSSNKGTTLASKTIAGRFLSEIAQAIDSKISADDVNPAELPVILAEVSEIVQKFATHYTGIVATIFAKYSEEPPSPAMAAFGRALVSAGPELFRGIDSQLCDALSWCEPMLTEGIESLVTNLDPVQAMAQALSSTWHGACMELSAPEAHGFFGSEPVPGELAFSLGDEPEEAATVVRKIVGNMVVRNHSTVAAQLVECLHASDYSAIRFADLPDASSPHNLDLDTLVTLVSPELTKQGLVAVLSSCRLLGVEIEPIQSKHHTVSIGSGRYVVTLAELTIAVGLVHYTMTSRAYEPVAALAANCGKGLVAAYCSNVRSSLLGAKAVERKQLRAITSKHLVSAASASAFLLKLLSCFVTSLTPLTIEDAGGLDDLTRIKTDLFNLRRDILDKVVEIVTMRVQTHVPHWFSCIAAGEKSGIKSAKEVAGLLVKEVTTVGSIVGHGLEEEEAHAVIGRALIAFLETMKIFSGKIDALIATESNLAPVFSPQARLIMKSIADAFPWFTKVTEAQAVMGSDEWARKLSELP